MDQPPTSMSASKSKPAQAVPKETLSKLAEKLKELVGEDFEMPSEQLVNEDGLPIIEFTEPVTQSRQRDFRIPSPPPLKPMPKTEAERIARRKETEAFFAALEEEERQEEGKKNGREEESEFMRVIMEAKEKAEEARTGENTRRNAGLLGKRAVNGSQSAESDEDAAASPNASNPTSKPKKAVKFADAVDDFNEKETTNTQTWGDVQQGRLRKPIGMKSGGDIMKLEIVEKFPSTPKVRVVDSDDEDDSDPSEEGEEDEDEDEEEQRNQIEIEDALHQREIALRYHEMRQSLGAGPRGGALGGFVDPATNDEWDQEDVPLDASLAEKSSGSNRSRFNANRLSDRTLNAHLPMGLAGEFRPATLENDQLVGAEDDGESDSDIGPRGRRIIEGLKRGLTVEEVMANEPSEDENEAASKAEVKPIKRGTALIGDVVEVQERVSKPTPQNAMPVKISKFKANRME